MGNILTIQTYGYGGSANAPGGTNASGVVISSGGFDPIIALYNGAISGNGTRLGFNDNGTCGPGSGTTDSGNCFDARLVFTNLAAGTYSLVQTVFSNFPPATENGAYPGGGSFGTRTTAFAVDVVASSAIPEPMTSMLVGMGLAGLVAVSRRRRRS